MARILVVDDEEQILALLKNALQKEGHEVIIRTKLAEEDFLKLGDYDLILLDVMMPGTDGFSLCRRLREMVDCPVLFLTAKSMEEDVAFGFSVGADDYIKKPFSVVELRARVQAHLRRERREKHQGFASAGLHFRMAQMEVWKDGQRIPFTKSEYEICELLAKKRGQVYSREQIYESVFGYEGESDVSAITEHIKNIRKKLAAAGCSPVETVWGIGYRWNEKA